MGGRWAPRPMKPILGPLPDDAGWTFEPKWDGHRCLARVGSRAVEAASSSGADRSREWAWLGAALAGTERCVLDGEIIGIGPGGRHDFELVGRSGALQALVVFDLLHHDGRDLCDQPWSDRRARLVDVVAPNAQLIVTPSTGDGPGLWTATGEQGFEGVVAKRTDSVYRPGTRSPVWVKAKHRWEQEFVVAGVRTGSGALAGSIGALLLGAHPGSPDAPDGPLQFVGSVGSGLSGGSRAMLEERVAALRSPHPPFEQRPAVDGEIVWLRPHLVVQVRFAGWTSAGRLRHPVFLGIRDDVDPATVVVER